MSQPDASANQPKIRVLIVDDIPETRHNLRKLLFSKPDIEPVWMASDGEQAVRMAVDLQPDIVLMDVLLPGIDGVTAAERITRQVPSARIILMSVQGIDATASRTMLAGASEFLQSELFALQTAALVMAWAGVMAGLVFALLVPETLEKRQRVARAPAGD